MSAGTQSPKVYVRVAALFDVNGGLTPRSIIWEDGQRYTVDRVLDVKPSAAIKSGGQGDRYTVRIRNQIRLLYFEHNPRYGETSLGKWFVEK